MVDVSFIIVSWNARKYLEICLKTIKKYVKEISYEVIVVDNASSDGSIELIKQEFPWCSLVETGENLGFAKANNIGIRRSIGRYICLVNSDVEFIDSTFSLLVKYMFANPKVGIIGPRMLNEDRTFHHSIRYYPTILNQFLRTFYLDAIFNTGEGGIKNKVLDVEALSGAFLLIRREAYEEAGELDEDFFMYSEDIDLCMRYKQSGWKIVYNPFAQIIHYGGKSSSNAPVRFYIEGQRARLLFARKHYSLFKYIIFYILLFNYNFFRFFYWKTKNIYLSDNNTFLLNTEKYFIGMKYLIFKRYSANSN